MGEKEETTMLVTIVAVNPLSLEVRGIVNEPIAAVLCQVGIERFAAQQGDGYRLEYPMYPMVALVEACVEGTNDH
jgi:hypothetical protein